MRGCVWECEILSCFSKRSDYCFFSDKWRICGNFLSRQSNKICIIQICRECIFLFSFIGSEIPKALSTLVQASETFQSPAMYTDHLNPPTRARSHTHQHARARTHSIKIQSKNIFFSVKCYFTCHSHVGNSHCQRFRNFFIILFLLSFFLAAV